MIVALAARIIGGAGAVGLTAGIVGRAHLGGPAVARSESVGGGIRRAPTETEWVETFARAWASGGEDMNLPIQAVAP